MAVCDIFCFPIPSVFLLCVGLTLAGHQAHSNAALLLLSSAGQWRQNKKVKMRIGRIITSYSHSQNKLH